VVGHVLIVWGLVVVALSLAFLFERRRNKGGEKPDYAVALGFVASSYGVLLGLLVAFGANHYTDVRHQAQAEADSLLALADAVALYPAPIRDRAQHDIVCYMRSVRDDDWPSMERGNPRQSPRTLRFGDHLRKRIHSLPSTGTHGEASAYGRAQAFLSDADKSRQDLLFFTESGIPTVMWVVIYVGAFLLFLLIALHYAGRPSGRLISLGAVVTLLTVVVAVISTLDQPYSAGARVAPTGINHSIELFTAGRTDSTVFGPCVVPARN
jgi:hypothetical protein